MTAPDLQLQLSATQAQFVQDNHQFSAFVAGIGAGKSFAGAAKALVQTLPAGGLGLVVAPTVSLLRHGTWRTCLEVWAPILQRAYRQEMRLQLRTGAEV